MPADDEVPEAVKSSYRWIEGLSVTEMEIMHGAYRKDNPNGAYIVIYVVVAQKNNVIVDLDFRGLITKTSYHNSNELNTISNLSYKADVSTSSDVFFRTESESSLLCEVSFW